MKPDCNCNIHEVFSDSDPIRIADAIFEHAAIAMESEAKKEEWFIFNLGGEKKWGPGTEVEAENRLAELKQKHPGEETEGFYYDTAPREFKEGVNGCVNCHGTLDGSPEGTDLCKECIQNGYYVDPNDHQVHNENGEVSNSHVYEDVVIDSDGVIKDGDDVYIHHDGEFGEGTVLGVESGVHQLIYRVKNHDNGEVMLLHPYELSKKSGELVLVGVGESVVEEDVVDDEEIIRYVQDNAKYYERGIPPDRKHYHVNWKGQSFFSDEVENLVDQIRRYEKGLKEE